MVMKVVKAQEMGRVEKLAYADGALEEEFMQKAGLGVAELAQHMIARYHLNPKIVLLCGPGNNGADAYVAGRILKEGGFQVHALSCAPFEKSSPLCRLQSEKFVERGGRIEYLTDKDPISFADGQLLIDGILGTGFHGEVQGIMKKMIEKANSSSIPVLAIDIPSGIDGNTGQFSTAICARDTLFLGMPKSGCFVRKAWENVGRVHFYDFGLKSCYIDQAQEDYLLIDNAFVKATLPPMVRTRHKYQAGYVVGIGGSKGMPGAPLMASLSALRAGAGIVRLLHPEGMEAELVSAPYELIRQGYKEDDVQSIIAATQKASALFIGPGLGVSLPALHMLQSMLPNINKPCVIDAEALTLVGAHEIPFPKQSILTPHEGEMKRLLKIERDLDFPELLEMANAYAQSKKVTVVLKGAPTFILHPGSKPYVTSRGDPGMATAGSGDVLTGIIAALLAQIHEPLKAAVLGVELHARAGEYAAQKWTSYCMKACDIIDALPLSFKEAGPHAGTTRQMF